MERASERASEPGPTPNRAGQMESDEHGAQTLLIMSKSCASVITRTPTCLAVCCFFGAGGRLRVEV